MESEAPKVYSQLLHSDLQPFLPPRQVCIINGQLLMTGDKARISQGWPRMDKDKSRMDKDGQGWTKIVKDGQVWTRMDKDGQGW